MADQKKRVALITGGTRGIGLGIARCLAQKNFTLAINGRRPAKDVEQPINELRSLGAEVDYFAADISSTDSRATMLADVRQQFGRLDVLVNNAGVAPSVRADILEATEESFERLMHINLQGPYFLTQAVAHWMIEQKKADAEFRGTVINVSSVSATVASVSRGDYCISKVGVAMATALWATRLAEFDIAVYEVRPGVIHTDMTAEVTEKYDKLIAEGLTVEPRWGTPEDVGRAVAVLASGEIRYATGNVIMVDGGLTLPRL